VLLLFFFTVLVVTFAFSAFTRRPITAGVLSLLVWLLFSVLGEIPAIGEFSFTKLGVLALQLRNASLIFKALDADRTSGTVDDGELTVSQNLGPVPALSLYARYAFDWGLQLTADMTGLYAS
jgi:ABC-type transport system involved in multi-copper enzyme maturation permease subunit